MNKIGVIAMCDFRTLPNGGEVFLLNNIFSNMDSKTNEYLLIGMSFSKEDDVGKWKTINLEKKQYKFLPVAKVLKDKEKTKVPFRIRMIIGILKYRKEIEKMGIKTIYVHSPEFGVLSWNKKYKMVYHVHCDPSQTLKFSRFRLFRSNIFTTWYLFFVNKTIACSDLIIWAANRSKELYLLAQPQTIKEINTKSITIHSSFDKRLKHNNSLLKLPDRTHFVTVSRLARIKHVDFIINAIKKLRDKGYDIDLIVCGDGEEMKSLKELSKKLKIEDYVIFLGLCNREQIATALEKSIGFLFASENEAMSLVVLESLYLGTPVVSVDVGDIRDAVKDDLSGYIINNHNIDDYIEAIEKIIKNKKEYYSINCIKEAMRFAPESTATNIDEALTNNI